MQVCLSKPVLATSLKLNAFMYPFAVFKSRKDGLSLSVERYFCSQVILTTNTLKHLQGQSLIMMHQVPKYCCYYRNKVHVEKLDTCLSAKEVVNLINLTIFALLGDLSKSIKTYELKHCACFYKHTVFFTKSLGISLKLASKDKTKQIDMSILYIIVNMS